MKHTKILVAAAAVLFAVVNLHAQKLHVINYCNTLDTSIGTQADLERIIKHSMEIAGALKYEFNYTEGVDEECSREKLMADLNNLQCGKEDIVLFYYSGHGMRSDKDKSPFPQMCLKYEGYEQEKWVPVHTVVEKLRSKGARLTLVITDCCNSIDSYVTAKSKSPMSKDEGTIDSKVVENIKKLFLGQKGVVVATSSKAGQPSAGSSKSGGFFSSVLFEYSLYKASIGKLPTTWQDVLSDVNRVFNANPVRYANEDGTTYEVVQEPYFEVAVTATNEPAQQTPVATATNTASETTATVISVDSKFATELSRILNNRLPRIERRNLADELARRYFSADAKVATVGRNGTTIVEYETAYDWLQRLASSKRIQSVNIIHDGKNDRGLRNYIKVQEIHNN